MSGYAHGNEQDLHVCGHEYGYGNADVNGDVRADEFLPCVITSFQGRKSFNSFSLLFFQGYSSRSGKVNRVNTVFLQEKCCNFLERFITLSSPNSIRPILIDIKNEICY